MFIGRNERTRARNERRKRKIIAGDYNQHTRGNETQKFYREIGVQDVLSEWETASWNDRDVTIKRGSRHIHSIVVSEGLMPIIEGFEAIEWDDKMSADHRGHILELNLEKFFNENLCELDQVNRSKLDSRRRSQKEAFVLKT